MVLINHFLALVMLHYDAASIILINKFYSKMIKSQPIDDSLTKPFNRYFFRKTDTIF